MKQNQRTTNEKNVEKNLANIHNIIAVMSGKGGVGKSTIATNLSLILSEQGFQVGLLDSDIHGPTIPTLLGIESKRIAQTENGLQPVQVTENLKVLSMGFLIGTKDDAIIWRGPMKMGVIKQLLSDFQWGSLDYLIIDLPPGTGDEPLTIAQLIPNIKGVVIVTTPQDVALVSVRKSITFARKLGLKIIGVIENMSGFSCPHCKKDINIFKMGGGKKAALDFNIPFLGSIPLDPSIVETGDQGSLMIKNDSQIKKSFTVIIDQIKKELKHKGE